MTARPPISGTTGFPVLTTIALGATALTTATRLFGPGVVEALQRDPDALRSGQVWRLLSPVLVQTDPTLVLVLIAFALSAVVGVVGERVFPRPLWITLYLVGALVGHGIGEWFQPYDGGTSVAFVGILGGLVAYALRRDAPVAKPLRLEAALSIPLAVLATVFRDIHGLPFLAGAAVAAVWLGRVRPDPS